MICWNWHFPQMKKKKKKSTIIFGSNFSRFSWEHCYYWMAFWPKIPLWDSFHAAFCCCCQYDSRKMPVTTTRLNDTNGLLRTISSGFWHSSGVNDRHATSGKLGAEPLVSYVTGFRSGKWEPISATFPFSICCLNKQWPSRCVFCPCSFSEKKRNIFKAAVTVGRISDN